MIDLAWGQTILFCLTPLVFFLLAADGDDDDFDGPDSGLMSPVWEGT